MIEKREQSNYERPSGFLAFGVIILTGLLSFSGMASFLLSLGLAWPVIIPLAILSSLFAVSVEGTVFFTNIKEALTKLFKPHVHRNELGLRFLKRLAAKPQELLDLEKRIEEAKTEDEQLKLKAQLEELQKLLREKQSKIQEYLDLEAKIKNNELRLRFLKKLAAKPQEHLDLEKEINTATAEEKLILEAQFKELRQKLQGEQSEIQEYLEEEIKNNEDEKLLLEAERDQYVAWFSWQLELGYKKRKDGHKHPAEDVDIQKFFANLSKDEIFYAERLRKEKYDPWLIFASVLIGLISACTSFYYLPEFFAFLGKLSASLLISAGAAHVIIPILAALVFAGVALQLYRTLDELLQSGFFARWKSRFTTAYENREWGKLAGLVFLSAALTALAVMLTYFTGYTNWTAAHKDYVLFEALREPIVRMVMGVLFVLTTVKDFFFNVQNSSQTVEELLGTEKKKGAVQKFIDNCKDLMIDVADLWEKENPLQFFNIFRFAKYLFINLLYSIFFIGHLISIGVSSDQIGDISKYWAVAVATVTEFFEDLSYLLEKKNDPHDHDDEDDGHNHDSNFLRLILSYIIIIPVFVLSVCACGWDLVSSKLNGLLGGPNKKEDWSSAWERNRPLGDDDGHNHGEQSGLENQGTRVADTTEQKDPGEDFHGRHSPGQQHHSHGGGSHAGHFHGGHSHGNKKHSHRHGGHSHKCTAHHTKENTTDAKAEEATPSPKPLTLRQQQFQLEEVKERLNYCFWGWEKARLKREAISKIQEELQNNSASLETKDTVKSDREPALLIDGKTIDSLTKPDNKPLPQKSALTNIDLLSTHQATLNDNRFSFYKSKDATTFINVQRILSKGASAA